MNIYSTILSIIYILITVFDHRYAFANELPKTCDCPAPKISVSLGIKLNIYTATVTSDLYPTDVRYSIEWVLQGGVAQRVSTTSNWVDKGRPLVYDIQTYLATGAKLISDENGYTSSEETVRALNNPQENPEYQLHLPPKEGSSQIQILNYKVFVRRRCGEGKVSSEAISSFSVNCLPVENLNAEVFDNIDGNGYANINWTGRNNSIGYQLSVSSNVTTPEFFDTQNTGYLQRDMNRSAVYKITVANRCSENSLSIRKNLSIALGDVCPQPVINFAMPTMPGKFLIQSTYKGQLATMLVSYRPSDSPNNENSWSHFNMSPYPNTDSNEYINRSISLELGSEPSHQIVPNKAYKLRIKLICKVTPDGIILSQSDWAYKDLVPFSTGTRMGNENMIIYDAQSQSLVLSTTSIDAPNLEYNIYDILGKELQRGSVVVTNDSTQNITIPLKNIHPGMYICTWQEDGKPRKRMFRVN